MELLQYHKLRTAVQVNAPPGLGEHATSMAANFRSLLLESGLFTHVEVEHTDDPDKLVIGLCRYRPHLGEREVALALEEIWRDRVRYPFWEAHSIVTSPDQVELEGATRQGPGGHYVTVHLVAQKTGVPAQRRAAD